MVWNQLKNITYLINTNLEHLQKIICHSVKELNRFTREKNHLYKIRLKKFEMILKKKSFGEFGELSLSEIAHIGFN